VSNREGVLAIRVGEEVYEGKLDVAGECFISDTPEEGELNVVRIPEMQFQSMQMFISARRQTCLGARPSDIPASHEFDHQPGSSTTSI